MTKEKINQYIYDKKIPLRIVWEDYTYYWLVITNNREVTHGNIIEKMGKSDNAHTSMFPNWVSQFKNHNEIEFFNYGVENIRLIQYKTDTSFEHILSEFLFWFEINKGRCKSITYYETI